MKLLKVEVFVDRDQLPGANNISDSALASSICQAKGVVDCSVDGYEVIIGIDVDLLGEFGDEGRLISVDQLPDRVALVKAYLRGAYGFEEASS